MNIKYIRKWLSKIDYEKDNYHTIFQKFLVSSYLYYNDKDGITLLSDHEYDSLCSFIESNYNEMSKNNVWYISLIKPEKDFPLKGLYLSDEEYPLIVKHVATLIKNYLKDKENIWKEYTL